MKDAPSPPDPYCAFKDDELRRQALEDRNRRDVRIAQVELCRWVIGGVGVVVLAVVEPYALPWVVRALRQFL